MRIESDDSHLKIRAGPYGKGESNNKLLKYANMVQVQRFRMHKVNISVTKVTNCFRGYQELGLN